MGFHGPSCAPLSPPLALYRRKAPFLNSQPYPARQIYFLSIWACQGSTPPPSVAVDSSAMSMTLWSD